jgi:hypothetical protein
MTTMILKKPLVKVTTIMNGEDYVFHFDNMDSGDFDLVEIVVGKRQHVSTLLKRMLSIGVLEVDDLPTLEENKGTDEDGDQEEEEEEEDGVDDEEEDDDENSNGDDDKPDEGGDNKGEKTTDVDEGDDKGFTDDGKSMEKDVSKSFHDDGKNLIQFSGQGIKSFVLKVERFETVADLKVQVAERLSLKTDEIAFVREDYMQDIDTIFGSKNISIKMLGKGGAKSGVLKTVQKKKGGKNQSKHDDITENEDEDVETTSSNSQLLLEAKIKKVLEMTVHPSLSPLKDKLSEMRMTINSREGLKSYMKCVPKVVLAKTLGVISVPGGWRAAAIAKLMQTEENSGIINDMAEMGQTMENIVQCPAFVGF